jgi:thiol-disulfide isomerase/thioredoxin
MGRVIAFFAALAVVGGCGTERPRGVEMVPAEAAGEVPAIVKRELERAARDHKQLLVYVGATWCEPCRRFHQAAAEHKLDRDFPQLRLLEFDDDRDGARLAMAGYSGQFIPLFARPGADGRGTGRQIEGSVKGDGAVDQIVPRLRTLLTP